MRCDRIQQGKNGQMEVMKAENVARVASAICATTSTIPSDAFDFRRLLLMDMNSINYDFRLESDLVGFDVLDGTPAIVHDIIDRAKSQW